jgi:hypothetical protein
MRGILVGALLSLVACLTPPKDDTSDRTQGGCFIGGCSSQICSGEEGIGSDCEWREEYACYRTATCERQDDGTCGWTATVELEACLESH